jgi:ABC-type amino acid transport substrate-binding protein
MSNFNFFSRLTLAFISATFIHNIASADAFDVMSQRGTIRLGFDEGAPFAFKTKVGAMGYSIDICNRIADAVRLELKKPKLKVEIFESTFDDSFGKVMDGSVDLHCGATTNNAKRREKVAFAIPTFIAGGRMLVPINSTIDRLDQLDGKRVAVSLDTTYDEITQNLVQKKGYKLSILKNKSDDEGMRLLLDGKVDVFMNDDTLLATFLANSGRSKEFRLTNSPLTVEPLAIMLKKDNPRLKTIANKVITDLMLSGEITNLHRKWFQSNMPELNINLNLSISTIMRAYIRAPSDFVPDTSIK